MRQERKLMESIPPSLTYGMVRRSLAGFLFGPRSVAWSVGFGYSLTHSRQDLFSSAGKIAMGGIEQERNPDEDAAGLEAS